MRSDGEWAGQPELQAVAQVTTMRLRLPPRRRQGAAIERAATAGTPQEVPKWEILIAPSSSDPRQQHVAPGSSEPAAERR